MQTTLRYTHDAEPVTQPGVAAILPHYLVESGIWGRVIRVWDGDTLTVEVRGERRLVRLVGMDAPEMRGAGGVPERWAQESRLALWHLCIGCQVLLVPTEHQGLVDRFGRWLRWVLRDPDGINLSVEMVRQGWAHATPQWPSELTGTLRAWEAWAKAQGVGMWG